ncbi:MULTISPECIES: c-type cytochrome biogenesis protein CcmI [Rhodomicrobium]|uniref:c-type cytochrome biogenesis protein CcmI n=1 Tax=Rhodomicrobium TaxID=1068 RepID=UPI000B4C129D|nr:MULTISPECIES: c-type cytochrome biogenesis protein CcmI [Rhodomicrobium]
MTLWLILTILSAVAALIVAAPFLFRGANTGAASSIDVYKDQLAEVERDRTQGLIEEAEAASMRLEIERRILSAGKAENGPADRVAPNWQYRMVTGVTSIVILGSVGLYASLGRPELAAVSAPAQDAWAQRAAVVAGPQGQTAQAVEGQPGGGDVEAMVKRLEQRLEANPKDADGWRVLGWSYDTIGRNQDAVTAYGKAVELQKDNPTLRALYGEAQVKAAGMVTDAALATFDEVLAMNPNDERARFFKGAAKQQKGDTQGAIDDWLALYKIAPADAEWTGDLRSRIEESAKAAGIDVSAKLAEAKPAGAAVAQAPAMPAHPGAVGPSAADIESAKQLSDQDRQSMVSGMVDRLAGRLETSPKDPDGWIMLIRSRMAMKDAEKARAALEKAKTVFADEPETQQRIVQAAQAMGVAAN